LQTVFMSLRTALVLALLAAVVATAAVLGGLELRNIEASVLREAQARARAGRAVYVNALMGRSAFRKGSISI
jgi:hypothetical protein